MSQPLFDFSRHEDLFQCIDTLTRASAAVAATDMDRAHELTRIINSLAAMAERTEDSLPLPGATATGLDDLMVPRGQQEKTPVVDDDTIIDVLTGEKIG